jgi:hypothetical protein
VLTIQVHLSSKFTRHLVETLDRIRYAVHRFETFTYDPVDRSPGKCELQTNSVSISRREREKREILTPRAESKASLHKSRVNFAFAHSLTSGVGVDELRVA